MSDWHELQIKWLGCEEILIAIWFEVCLSIAPSDSSELVVSCCEIEAICLSSDLRWQLIWNSKDLVVNEFEIQMAGLWIDLRFKRLGCLRTSDSIDSGCQCFEGQKQSISAKLPSKMKLWSSKTKHFCETSFKNEALKINNEAFLRDLLQKWHVDRTLDLRIPIRFYDFWVDASKVLCLPRKSWTEAYELL